MPLEMTLIGRNDDGTPLYGFVSVDVNGIAISDPRLTDEERADRERFPPVVMTGPIYGPVKLADGTVYDVSAPVIEVKDGHEAEAAHLVSLRQMRDGHPAHVADDEAPDFVYVPAPEFVHHLTDDELKAAHDLHEVQHPEEPEDRAHLVDALKARASKTRKG